MALIKKETANLYLKLPSNSGVYVFLDKQNKPIYIGKANSLRERIKQHFTDKTSHKERHITQETVYLKLYKTNSELEALLLEANLINRHKPKYNAVLLDDRSRLYMAVTKEEYPKVRLIRQRDINQIDYQHIFGPLSSLALAKMLVRKLRQAVPFCTESKISSKPCFYSQINLCSPCPNLIAHISCLEQKKELKKQYRQNINRLTQILKGQGLKLLAEFKRELKQLAKKEQFEEAALMRDRWYYLDTLFKKSLEPIDRLSEPNYIRNLRLQESRALQQVLGLKKLSRVECYDISNLNFKEATASMVVFVKGESHPELYRRFRIKNRALFDPEMLTEVLLRRFRHSKWGHPSLVVIDGGTPQLLMISQHLKQEMNLPLIVGFAKRPDRLILPDKTIVNLRSFPLALTYLQRLRDEAHRFAKKYHLYLRRQSFEKSLTAIK